MNYLLTTTLGIVACLLFFNHTFSQDQEAPYQVTGVNSYISEITAVYGNEWVANNPDAVSALEACFANRMTYLVEPLTEQDKYPLLSSFPLMNKYNPAITAINYPAFDPSTFVPITYNLPFFSDLKQVVRVDGTDYIIVIEPITTTH